MCDLATLGACNSCHWIGNMEACKEVRVQRGYYGNETLIYLCPSCPQGEVAVYKTNIDVHCGCTHDWFTARHSHPSVVTDKCPDCGFYPWYF